MQFGTVFLGAFLAFVIENVRERRRLRGWVRKYLERFYSDLREGVAAQEEIVRSLEMSTASYQKFTEPNSDVTLNEWRALLTMYYGLGNDFRLLLEGDALRVLPAEVVRAVNELQKVDDANTILNRLLADLHGRYVVPVALNKTWPLSEPDRAALAYFKRVADVSLTYQKRVLEAMKGVQTVLERHHLAPRHRP